MTVDFNYSPIRATSREDGTPAQIILDMYDLKAPDKSRLFGIQDSTSQDGLAIFVDCKCPMTMSERIEIEPRLAELQFRDGLIKGDRPKYLTKSKNDYSKSEALLVVKKIGLVGQAWADKGEVF